MVRLHVRQRLMAPKIFGGREKSGDGTFAGAAKKIRVAKIDLQPFDGGEGEADRAIESGIRIEQIIAHGSSRADRLARAECGPCVGHCIIQRRQDGAGGDG